MAQRFKTGISIEEANSAASQAVAINVDNDTHNRLTIDAGGKISWGPGNSSTLDTNLYRDTTGNLLKTDDGFTATSLAVTSQYTLPTTAGSANQVLGYNASASFGFRNTGVKVVVHADQAGTARPSGVDQVIWIGTVAPTNGSDNDIWFDL